jgi:predicted DNA-binding protein (MmcQ/YjbR family)
VLRSTRSTRAYPSATSREVASSARLASTTLSADFFGELLTRHTRIRAMTRHDESSDSREVRAVLAKLRMCCLALPGTTETPTWGHPNFRVDTKIFAAFGHYGGRPSIGTKQTKPDQLALCSDPRFFVSPYVGKHGWTSVHVDEPVAWSLIEDLVLRSYRLIASKARIAELDARVVASRPVRKTKKRAKVAKKKSKARKRPARKG